MAKNSLLEYSTTPDNNTDIGGIGIQGTSAVNNFDNAFRTLMAQMRQDIDYKQVYALKTANYAAVANDNNAVLRFNTAATLTLTAAATLGANWHIVVRADGGAITIDPNGSETVNGAETFIVPRGAAATLICDGTQFFLSLDDKTLLNTKSADYTAVANDNGATLFFSAAATLTLTAAATLGANWRLTVFADGGLVTIDPNGTETINGATTLSIPAGVTCEIICSGTDFKARLSTMGKSSGSNWTRLLDGKLLQWGTTTGVTDAGGNLGVFFPTAFAGATSYNVVAWNGDSGVAGGNILYSQLRSTPWPQATGFAVSARTANTGAAYANSAIRVDWYAIGVAP